MASPKKESLSIKIFWTKFIRRARLLLGKGKRFALVLALPPRLLKAAYQRWPRIIQMCSIYLFVLLLAGAVFLWRSAQLRTINPYADKIRFSALEEDSRPGLDANPPGPEGSDEPAVAGPEAAEPEVQAAEPLPQPVWPVQGKLLRGFDDSYLESLAPLDLVRRRKCKWIEIEAEPGAEIGSLFTGTVEKIISSGYPGCALKIRHENGLVAYYAALDEIRVVEGQAVRCGEIIATIRENDKTMPAYLYLEIWQEGRRIDPLDVLP